MAIRLPRELAERDPALLAPAVARRSHILPKVLEADRGRVRAAWESLSSTRRERSKSGLAKLLSGSEVADDHVAESSTS